MDKRKNVIITCLGALLIVMSLIFYSTNGSSLELFKETKLNEKTVVKKILEKIDQGENLKEFSISNNILNVSYDLEYVKYEILEKNSSILFYLIEDLDELNFSLNDEKFSFNRDEIEKIYRSFEAIDIKFINNRYENILFENTYLGNIDGVYDVFDVSELCLEKMEQIYQDDNFAYYISCSSLNDLILVSSNKQYKLADALEQKMITIDDLFKTSIKISKVGLDSSENPS